MARSIGRVRHPARSAHGLDRKAGALPALVLAAGALMASWRAARAAVRIEPAAVLE